MILFLESTVENVYMSYPEEVRSLMFGLRDLVYTTAQEVGVGNDLAESLKWGEPSFLCKSGSTLRMHWVESDPEFCRVFFHCQTNLVETFRELYPDVFEYEGNRAIRLRVGHEVDLVKLGHCVGLTLRYHLIKHLPLLGVVV